MSNLPTQFAGVTVVTKANVYFDGNVVSHTVLFADQSKKTLGLIRPGTYHFNTAAAERIRRSLQCLDPGLYTPTGINPDDPILPT